MKDRNVSSTAYRYRFTPTPAIVEYYELAKIGYTWMTDFFLDLFGGIRVQDLTNARYNLRKKKDEDREEEEDIPKGVHADCTLLFHHWFVLEDREGADPRTAATNPAEVWKRFEKYLSQDCVKLDPEWAETLHATVMSVQGDEDRVWVDRRFSNYLRGIPRDLVAWLLSDANFYLQETSGDANTYARKLASKLWGDGKKSDWARQEEVARTLLREVSELTPAVDLRRRSLEILGIQGVNLKPNEVSRQVLGKVGTPNDLSKFLAGAKDLPIRRGDWGYPEFRKMLRACLKSCDWNTSLDQHSREFALTLHDELHRRLGGGYALDDIGIDCKGEFGGKALERIASHRKNSLNKLLERKMLDRHEVVLPDYLTELFARRIAERVKSAAEGRKRQNNRVGKFAKKGAPFLTQGDIAGLKDLEEYYEPKDGFLEAARLAEKYSRRRRSNFEFLKAIAERLDKFGAKPKILDKIREYQEIEHNKYKFAHRKAPRLARFTRRPDHPTFGTSRPQYSYRSLGDGEFRFTLRVLTRRGLVNETVVARNARAEHDLCTGPVAGGIDAPRRTKLFAVVKDAPLDDRGRAQETAIQAMIGGKPAIESGKGMKLVCGEGKKKGQPDRWFLIQTFDLPNEPTLPTEAFAKPTQGWKLVAFDPGIRRNITQATGELTQRIPGKDRVGAFVDPKNPDVFFVPVLDGWWLRIKKSECGYLTEQSKQYKFTRHDYQVPGNYPICRLETKSWRDTPEECREFFGDLKSAKIVTGDCPDKMPSFLAVVLGALRHRFYEEDAVPDPAHARRLIQLCKDHRRTTGYMTYRRILNLKAFKSLMQSHLSLDESGVKVLSEEDRELFTDQLDYCTKKMFNLRAERFRLVANMVAEHAAKTHAVAVIAEKTTLDVHYKSSKEQMRRVDIWTPRQVLQQCRDQLNRIGVYFRKELADYTSHTDFLDAKEGARIDYTTLEIRPRYQFQSAAEIRDRLEAEEKRRRPRGETDKKYREAMGKWLADRGHDWSNWREMEIEGEIFPTKGGSIFRSRLLGDIDSDQNAAIFLLVRGAKNLIVNGKEKIAKNKKKLQKEKVS